MTQPIEDTLQNLEALNAATPNAATLQRSMFYLAVLLECANRLSAEEFAECISRAGYKEVQLNARLAAGER